MPVPPPEAGRSISLRFASPTGQRGVYRLRPVHLWCFDSVALFVAPVATGPSATMTVLPEPIAVSVTPDLFGAERDPDQLTLVTASTPRRQHNLGDFAGLRSYVPGDRLRLLYWPALARTGELLVRDFEDAGPRHLHVLADIRSHLGPRGIESVLSVAAGAGLAALAAGAVIEFATTGGDRVAVGPGPLADLALLRAIAAVAVVPPRPGRGRHGRTPSPPNEAVPAFTRADMVITTHGGANSLPPVLRHGHVVVVS